MFQATVCPGPYLQSKFPYIVSEVNKALQGTQTQPTPAPAQPTTPSTPAATSFLVKVTTNKGLNIRKGPGTNYPVTGTIKDQGTYTIVETKGNWGKLKSGAGWICLDYTKRV